MARDAKRRRGRRTRLTMAVLASLALVAGQALAASAAMPAAPGPAMQGSDPAGTGAAVEEQVRAELAAAGTTTFWVYLRDRADLTGAAAVADRAAQGWLVYDRLTETAAASQAGLVAMLDAEQAAYESYWIANTVRVTGDAALLERIAARPEVAQVTADRGYAVPEPIPAAEQPRIQQVEWNIDRINAPRVWSEFGVTGEGIVVGSIDTGVQYDHPALVDQYRGNLGDGEFAHDYHWWDPSGVCGSPSLAPCDNQGHGTHVTGTMVGDDGGANQIGVAPGAQWIAAKGCETDTCSQSALLSSGQFMLAPTDLAGDDPDPQRRPHVVNNSWGGDADTDPWFRPTVRAWLAAGIFPQFASGNTSPGAAPCGSASNPGNLPESYAAGAFDIGNNLGSFSNRGPSAWGSDLVKPNISAPGVAVRSAAPGDSYRPNTGTSMASPHVAGTVALMWSAAPALARDVDATRELLDRTAIDTEDLTCGGTPENNNAWGQGRLDAFAAVDQSPRPDTGTLAGVVTDSGTGAVIAGATVTATGAVERERATGDDGRYAMTLPSGEFTVTASAFGYQPRTAPATIVEDGTTTRDFALAPVDTVTVSGRITDGSGHDWPLYAEVTAQGTPARTFTDPVTGRYHLTLPAGDTYTLVVESRYPGYAGATVPIEVGDRDLTRDLALEVELCADAPGYEFGARVGVLGDFQDQITDFLTGRGIPSTALTWGDDWSGYDVIIVNRPGDPGQDTFRQFLAETDAAGTGVVFLDNCTGDGDFCPALAPRTGIWNLWRHTDLVGARSTRVVSAQHISYRVVAEHPILAGAGVGEEIAFVTPATGMAIAWFDGYAGTVIADVSVARAGVAGPGIGVQERDTNRHALLSLHAASPFLEPTRWTDGGQSLLLDALHWVTDGAAQCRLVEGGLVLGHATDLNTGAGVDHATVTSQSDPDERGVSFSPPGDPALAGGFYWLFSSRTGQARFTAAAADYAPVTGTVAVVADATNRADFALPAGQLVVDPAGTQATVPLGQSASRTFTITNTGTAPAEVELLRRPGSFEILGGTGDAHPEVRNVEGYFTPAAEPAPAAPTGAPARAGPSVPPWQDIADYPQDIMDNSAVWVDGQVYSFGGWADFADVADAYRYDPEAGDWDPIAELPGARRGPGVAAIDGRIYVVGGWPSPPVATTLIYDPATDSWSRGADLPAGRAAPGVAVAGGQLYVIGGCVDGACHTSNAVWRYDPDRDAWTTLAHYPEPTAWLGCAGLDGRVYCAGGTDGEGASSATYAYDPASDSWIELAAMPYDNWAMAHAAVGDQLVVSSGVTAGLTTVTNRSAVYDPGRDAWREIEPANHATYRMGSACGFYKIGGSPAGLTAARSSEVHPGFGGCRDADVEVPWLSVEPATATLAPGDRVTGTVSLDSAATDEQQPGSYTAGIGIRHDTPYRLPAAGVAMDVTPPPHWGKITGTVTTVDCQGVAHPLAGAAVQIDGRHLRAVRHTGAGGGYTYWLSATNNPLELLVAAAGHQPEHRTTRVRPGRATVEDIPLHQVCRSQVE